MYLGLTTMNISEKIAKSISALLLLLFASTNLQADQNDLQLTVLFNKLQQADSVREARLVEAKIMHIWNLSGDESIDQRMGLSDNAMRMRSFDKALEIVMSVTEERPEFSEGWNLQATILFFMGRYEESLESVERTLTLEPRHFGAMIGKGDMLVRQGKFKEARVTLQRVMKVYPLHQRVIQRLERIDDAIKIKAGSYV
jgi:tetratricopeptide (TPR) repeat protein